MEHTKYPKNLNPFIAVWTRPRVTVRYVIEEKSSRFTFLLIVLSGFVGGLLATLNAEQFLPIVGIFLLALFLGPIGAAVSTAIGSGIYLLVGRLFKGEATYKEMFRALLTGQIPQIWLTPIIILWLLLLPETYFAEAGQLPAEDMGIMTIIFTLILGVVSIWTLFVQSNAVGEAHRFSAWKGFFVITIPAILFVGIIVSIIVAITMAIL
ncbi:MAG: YIP1 family protein [Planococcus sp. (in: firmicutes)]